MNIMKEIQQKLKAPKDQSNDFGGFKYRSAEGILEAVKPLLAEHDCYLNISDEVVLCGDRVYIKATASIYTATTGNPLTHLITATALAREPLERKGMDASQLTGTASSYARKYALNGLFGIDDTKDADSNEYHGSDEIHDPKHRFKPGEREELVKQVKDAIYNGDASHLKEVWHEQPRTAQLKVWGDFTAAERVAIKKLLENENE